MSSDERRIRDRFPTPGMEGELDRSPVQIRDVCLTGIGFETRKQLLPKRKYALRLSSPIGSFTVTGRVVWCHLASTVRTEAGDVVALYRAGMRFDPLSNRDAESLLRLLERLAANDFGARRRAKDTAPFSQAELTGSTLPASNGEKPSERTATRCSRRDSHRYAVS